VINERLGEVYRAFDRALRRHVALKLLLPGTSSDDEVSALMREARAIARVRHPNVSPSTSTASTITRDASGVLPVGAPLGK